VRIFGRKREPFVPPSTGPLPDPPAPSGPAVVVRHVHVTGSMPSARDVAREIARQAHSDGGQWPRHLR
jgi:hypothetical protein